MAVNCVNCLQVNADVFGCLGVLIAKFLRVIYIQLLKKQKKKSVCSCRQKRCFQISCFNPISEHVVDNEDECWCSSKRSCPNVTFSAFMGPEQKVTLPPAPDRAGGDALALTPGQVWTPPPPPLFFAPGVFPRIQTMLSFTDRRIKTENLQLNADIILEIYVSIKK